MEASQSLSHYQLCSNSCLLFFCLVFYIHSCTHSHAQSNIHFQSLTLSQSLFFPFFFLSITSLYLLFLLFLIFFIVLSIQLLSSYYLSLSISLHPPIYLSIQSFQVLVLSQLSFLFPKLYYYLLYLIYVFYKTIYKHI